MPPRCLSSKKQFNQVQHGSSSIFGCRCPSTPTMLSNDQSCCCLTCLGLRLNSTAPRDGERPESLTLTSRPITSAGGRRLVHPRIASSYPNVQNICDRCGRCGSCSSRRCGRSWRRVNGEWPRKAKGRQVPDLFPPNRITHGTAFKDGCLLYEEVVRGLQFGGVSARTVGQMPVLQDALSC